ncbi:MAG TPA: nickel-dependent lactate racemase [Candidatus Methylomirabilis sp.]|nr:nickel-dependent lactate racemase [Candidatus Methylomirabilis sp.]
MEVPLKYGHETRRLRIGDAGVRVCVLTPGRAGDAGDAGARIRSALESPIGSPRLSRLVSPGQQVAIVTADITRPCPSEVLIPPLLEELRTAGIADRDIRVVLGLGTHRAHTPEERRALLGEEVYRRVRCIDSDPTEVERVGVTRRGTPVEVFTPVLRADVRVCVGVIEYHYFVGYSGGVKALVPGVCSAGTIQHNHRRMTEPGAVAGRLDGNPVREDIEEAGELVGADFILNVVLDEAGRVVRAVAGHPRLAHRAGCAALDGFGRATVPRPADLVVVGAGGYPKDINLYQAQKALDNARQVVRPGGVLVLVAECREGLGNPTFEAWMQDPGGPDAILARIRREFVLGGHKAAAVALAMKQAEIHLVSALERDLARRLGFSPFEEPDAGLAAALTKVGPGPFVVVMPEGGSVLPSVGGPDGEG